MIFCIISINVSVIAAVWFLTAKFCNRKKVYCNNINELDNYFLVSKNNLTYSKLNESDTSKQIKIMYSKLKYPMFTDKILLDNKNFLITLSKFVDYKINNSKQTFRAKSKIILIDHIAYILSNDMINSCECNIFSKFKLTINKYKLRQKEIRIFKMLLAKHILIKIINIENELTQISKIIKKSKNAKYLKKYNKMILKSANIYGIYKFNQNSNKLLYEYKGNIKQIIKNLFVELIESEFRLKLAVTYLKVLFN